MSLCEDLEAALKQAQAVSERLTAAAVHHLLAIAQTEPAPKGIVVQQGKLVPVHFFAAGAAKK